MTRLSPSMLAALAGLAVTAPSLADGRVRLHREPSAAAKKRAVKRNRKKKAQKNARRRNRR